ncbi:uridine kinase [bacterium]|nr:uridine kinase [bacterium]
MNVKQSGILIGIAGGTGSGKTKVARRLLEDMGPNQVTIIDQDSYYRDLRPLEFEERAAQNFDHPNAIDTPLLLKHMKALLNGQSIDRPIYNFKDHLRQPETIKVEPHSIYVLEGILILYYPELRALMDIKVFVDTDADIRFIRRLKRDLNSRGRTLESVIHQYQETVRPMHMEFVEPSKRFADIIIPEGGYNHVAVDLLRTKIHSLL